MDSSISEENTTMFLGALFHFGFTSSFEGGGTFVSVLGEACRVLVGENGFDSVTSLFTIS